MGRLSSETATVAGSCGLKIDNCIGSLIEVEILRLGDARLEKYPKKVLR